MSAAFDPLHKTILLPKLRESPQISRENDLNRQGLLVRLVEWLKDTGLSRCC